MTLLERMADLHRQATVERSHHYVGSTLMDAADRIMALEVYNAELNKLVREAMNEGLDEYWVTLPEGKSWLERARKEIGEEGDV